MITDTEYRFKVSLTRDPYPKKPDRGSDEYSSIWFERQELSIDDFAGAIEAGYGYTYVYNQQKFHIKYKTKENFRYTKVLAFDIDDTDCDMETAFESCAYPPTIAYRTYSDGEDGKCSYRFVYIFNDYINSLNFKEIYHSVATTNNFKDLDARELNQFYFGTDKGDSRVSYIVYSLKDFNVERLSYRTSTPLILSEDGTYYTFPDEYYEIRRLWGFDPYSKRKFIRKYTDEGKLSRRKQLFIDGQLIKKINDITNQDTLYKILKIELNLYYDNTVDVITDEELRGIARRVIQKGFSCKPCTKHPSFRINVPYWKSVMNVGNNVYKPIAAVNYIKKQIKVDKFKQLYNPSLTNSENLKIMEENGFKIDKRTLQRYKKLL